MIWLYVAAAIFGGAFVLAMMAGGLDIDGDVELDFDTDVDIELGTEVDSDGFGDAAGDFLGSLLSFRSVVFFSMFFGLAGMVFNLLDYTEPVPLVTGMGLGAVAAVVNTQLFRWVKHGEGSSQITNRELSGSRATVVVPLGTDRRGRIKAELEGETTFMVALPYSTTAKDHYDVGDTVVVVEIENGTARVAPLPGLELGEEH